MDPHNIDNDLELINRFKKGDTKSLEILYNNYKDKLLKLIWYYVYNQQDAEDILQNVFMKLLRSIFKYTPRKNVLFRTWLFRVAINSAKDHLKKKKMDVNLDMIKEPDDEREYLESKMEQSELQNQLIREVLKLPVKYRDVIYLIYFEEYSYKEASAILKKPLGTIKSRLNYALNLLKGKFK
jgi:RNA polymerase sigma-70 factor (ECF subfamily)